MDKLELSEHLRKLGNREIDPRNKQYGVCSEIGKLVTRNLFSEVCDLMALWPEGTGNKYLPVPHWFLSPGEAYSYTFTKWGWTRYGRARRRLCLWLAEELLKVNNTPEMTTTGNTND